MINSDINTDLLGIVGYKVQAHRALFCSHSQCSCFALHTVTAQGWSFLFVIEMDFFLRRAQAQACWLSLFFFFKCSCYEPASLIRNKWRGIRRGSCLGGYLLQTNATKNFRTVNISRMWSWRWERDVRPLGDGRKKCPYPRHSTVFNRNGSNPQYRLQHLFNKLFKIEILPSKRHLHVYQIKLLSLREGDFLQNDTGH